jgi:hypothetical protein
MAVTPQPIHFITPTTDVGERGDGVKGTAVHWTSLFNVPPMVQFNA